MGFTKNIKKAGGFLNNQAGVITGYKFTTTNVSGDAGEWVYFVPSIRQDGAEEDVTQHLFLGSEERYEISADGQTVTGPDGGEVRIGANTPAGKFLISLVEGGFPEASLPDLEAGEALNLASVIGTRAQFIQRVDEEGTKKLGKRKDKKTGKEYDRTDTVIDRVIALPSAPAKGGAKAPAAKGAKGKAAAPAADVSEVASAALLRYLEAADGELPKSKIRMKVLTDASFKSDTATRDAVIKFLGDDANYASIESVTLDGGVVSIG